MELRWTSSINQRVPSKSLFSPACEYSRPSSLTVNASGKRNWWRAAVFFLPIPPRPPTPTPLQKRASHAGYEKTFKGFELSSSHLSFSDAQGDNFLKLPTKCEYHSLIHFSSAIPNYSFLSFIISFTGTHKHNRRVWLHCSVGKSTTPASERARVRIPLKSPKFFRCIYEIIA